MNLLRAEDLDILFSVLQKTGYATIGPTLKNRAIVFEEITSTSDLPKGVKDTQKPGSYRLEKRQDGMFFGFASSPSSWKRLLFPPDHRLWKAYRTRGGFATVEKESETRRYAFIGVRACDLHAIAVQDRVFTGDQFADGDYQASRNGSFIVAVNCITPAQTCFCTTMNTGPEARQGFDLALTELVGETHVFLVQAGSETGRSILQQLPANKASRAQITQAKQLIKQAAEAMQQRFDVKKVRHGLIQAHDHPHWQEVADRCLACGNCTLVCPTCFCTKAFEITDVHEQVSERWRSWDSCFSGGFSYMHGGSVRASIFARYRQWLTHKLSTWHDRFGTSGCVGCGRCITWCPAAIDLTEEAKAIVNNPGRDNEGH